MFVLRFHTFPTVITFEHLLKYL